MVNLSVVKTIKSSINRLDVNMEYSAMLYISSFASMHDIGHIPRLRMRNIMTA